MRTDQESYSNWMSVHQELSNLIYSLNLVTKMLIRKLEDEKFNQFHAMQNLY